MQALNSGKKHLLSNVLASVSRAFYLSMSVLPAGVREPISIAYLLARAADTAADMADRSPAERLSMLAAFKSLLESPRLSEQTEPLTTAIAQLQGDMTASEAALLRLNKQCFELYFALSDDCRQAVQQVVLTLIAGMEMDLRQFPGSFQSDAQLERYTYLVAGCVGPFWTRVTWPKIADSCHLSLAQMEELGESFGKALQYTNILRDIPKDLQNGRAYIPCPGLSDFLPQGSAPSDQLHKLHTRLRPWLETALAHYKQAITYILALPAWQWRLRFAVVLPVAIGLETLRLLAQNDNWPQFGQRIKVSRRTVYLMMAAACPSVCCDALLAWELNSLHALAVKAAEHLLCEY